MRAARLARNCGRQARRARVLAHCRRLVRDDATAAKLAPRVFVKVQGKLGGDPAVDDAVIARAAAHAAASIPGPRALPDDPSPTDDELGRAADRFAREVYKRLSAAEARDEGKFLIDLVKAGGTVR